MIKSDKKMKKQVTRKPTKSWRKEQVIDPNTGELVDRFTFEIEEHDANFHKLWLWHIAAALELIGNQKIRILSHVLTNANSDNIFIGTMRDISEKTETSTNTVNITIQLLMEADILRKQQSGVYFINPEIIFKGSANKRMDILYQYKNKPKSKRQATADIERGEPRKTPYQQLEKQAKKILGGTLK